MIALLWANPLVRKITIYAALVLVASYSFRLWLNKHDSRVYQQGKTAMAVQMEKAKQTEWKIKEMEIANKAAAADQARKAASEDLKRALDQIQKERKLGHAGAASVTADRLAAELLELSRQLESNR